MERKYFIEHLFVFIFLIICFYIYRQLECWELLEIHGIEYHTHRHEIAEPAAKYLERIKRLQREHRAIKRQIERDKKRVQFIMENCDMYKRAEHHYLYGDDL